MQGRLITDKEEQKDRARKMGVTDFDKKYDLEEMASGDVYFAATGVTDGSMLSGVKFSKDGITTDTVVMRASTRTVRWVKTQHTDVKKFED